MDTEGAVYLMNAKCGARDVDDKGDEGCAPPLHSPSFFFFPSLFYEPSLNYNFFNVGRIIFPSNFFFFFFLSNGNPLDGDPRGTLLFVCFF